MTDSTEGRRGDQGHRDGRGLRPPGDKILERVDLIARFGRPRNLQVVFTNGCFDLLHPGHVSYLHRARTLGDVLVVGVNTDASVTRLKGSGRPLVDQHARAVVLAGLEAVDAVTLFDEDTPADLIGALLPDVLVKGGDYVPEEVVGKAEVEAAGGEVRIIPFLEGYSTTGLVERIRTRRPSSASPGPGHDEAGAPRAPRDEDRPRGSQTNDSTSAENRPEGHDLHEEQ